MKHFILLLVCAFAIYFHWHYSGRSTRNRTKKFMGKHFLRLLLIVVAIAAMFLSLYYGGSINLL